MRDAQRDGPCDGSETRCVTKRGGLRPKGEPDTFYCSHRCLLSRRLWLGARPVFKHRRVPFSKALCLSAQAYVKCFLKVLFRWPVVYLFRHREKEESSCPGTREAWREKGRQGTRGKAKPRAPTGNRRESCPSPMGEGQETQTLCQNIRPMSGV